MIAQRDLRISDILAATGQAGMQEAAGDKFWTWRRKTLAVGYGLVFLDGLWILLASDPTGLILMAAAVAGLLFLHRTWVGVTVWIYVAAAGIVAVISGDDLGFYGLVVGLGLTTLALPWRTKQAAPTPALPHWQPSPFLPPSTELAAVEPALPIDLAPERLTDPVAVAQTKPPSTPEPLKPLASNGHVGPDPKFPGVLIMSTIGTIQLTIPGRDLTPDLMRRPVIGFLWLYLFARETRKAGDRITRTSLIDEVAYGVADPRGRLRGYLRDLSHLPAPLGAMIKVEGELIGFDMQRQDSDIDELRELADRIRQSGRTPDPIDIQHAQELVPDIGDGEFLPGFEDMEKRVTKGRGIAGQIVAEVRAQVHTLRADVAVAVASALLDRGQAADAVALLDPFVAGSEDRDDVVQTLITALRECGQHNRAGEIRRRHVAGQER